MALRPFSGAQETSIKAAVDLCNARGDDRAYYIDTTGWYDGPRHPDIAASAALAGKLFQSLREGVPGLEPPSEIQPGRRVTLSSDEIYTGGVNE